jgi:hypothetical protein
MVGPTVKNLKSQFPINWKELSDEQAEAQPLTDIAVSGIVILLLGGLMVFLGWNQGMTSIAFKLGWLMLAVGGVLLGFGVHKPNRSGVEERIQKLRTRIKKLEQEQYIHKLHLSSLKEEFGEMTMRELRRMLERRKSLMAKLLKIDKNRILMPLENL